MDLEGDRTNSTLEQEDGRNCDMSRPRSSRQRMPTASAARLVPEREAGMPMSV
jgi:hypothetical protein